MKFTKHSNMRKVQRGFTEFTLNVITKLGSVENAHGGASRIVFGEKEYQKIVGELKRTIQLMDRAKRGAVIVKDGYIITMYKRQ